MPELLAFFFLVFGTLLYNEIVIMPIEIMKRNTKVEREKREVGKLDGDEIEQVGTAGYVNTSPGAMYDQGRNLRAIDKKMKERDGLVEKHQRHMLAPSEDEDEFIASESNNGKTY